jgi:protein-S-isoprenylcysteine O-methyltransferase Ste14
MSPRILAVATFALTVVAIVGLILDGPKAAYFPAATALLAGLSIYLQIRHPQTQKHWTRRRVIDTTAFFVLLAAFVLGGFLVTRPASPIPWTLPVTVLVIIATMPFSLVGLVREALQAPQATPRAANERDHGTGPST